MKNYKGFRISWKIAAWVLYLCLIVSLSTLIIYLIDLQYSDGILFLLLIIIRYSSFMLCIAALYKLIINIYHFFRRPNILRALNSLLYILMITYGVAMVFLETLIVAFSKGTN